MHGGLAPLDLPSQVEVGGAGQIGVDPALHADLGGPGRNGLVDPLPHLGKTQRERIRIVMALGEGTEPATGVADVGEVDVAIDHVGDI